jgi:glycosyltransferase involved in cell wall biosynthesis
MEIFYKWRSVTSKTLPIDFFRKRNRLFQKYVLKKYDSPKVFIGFDTSSEYIFEKWKGKAALILDLTIAAPQYKQKLASDYGLSERSVQNLTKGDEVWYDTYEKELELADLILCGSDFVKQSCLYLGISEAKLKVIPYGANLEKFVPQVLPCIRPIQPFKIAFVGNVSYRKGADVLLSAWKELSTKYDNIELHFFGNLQIEVSGYSLKNVFFHGFVTQAELIESLSFCHVSILPTFFEGSSYAIYQSMAMALAIITTANAGSIIEHGKNGLIIPYGSVEALISSLEILIEKPLLRKQLGLQAQLNIKEYTWDNYGERLQSILDKVIVTS